MMKTKVVQTQINYAKTITLAEIRKKFNLSDEAEVTITLPFKDYDNRGGKFVLGEDAAAELVATWKKVT